MTEQEPRSNYTRVYNPKTGRHRIWKASARGWINTHNFHHYNPDPNYLFETRWKWLANSYLKSLRRRERQGSSFDGWGSLEPKQLP